MTIILAPNECVFAIGVPTTKTAFLATVDRPNTYASQFSGGWFQYGSLWVDLVEQFYNKASVTGVKFEFETSSATLGNLFRDKSVKCIFLLAHWHGLSIELSDGFIYVAAFVDLIPTTYGGILDLCVCHPDPLVDRLRIERPDSLVRYVPRKARPDLWLMYYDKFLRMLASGITYDEAMTSLTVALLNLKP